MTDSAPAAEVVATPTAPVTPAPAAVAPVSVTPDPAKASPAPAPAAAAPAPEAVVTPKTPTTLLGAEPPKTDGNVVPLVADKPAEAPKTDAPVEAEKAPEAKEGEAAKSDEPAPLPTYEPFKLPEGMPAIENGFADLQAILSDIELAKGDHGKMQESGQKLVDRHIAGIKDALKAQGEYFLSVFEQQKTDWVEAVKKDPEIGGNRFETTLNAANEFIRTHGGSPAQQEEFRGLMESTGIGSHPAMIRLLAKANLAMREGKPVPASKPESAPMSKVQKRYGSTN